VCGLDSVYFVSLQRAMAWEYRYLPVRFPWLCGATLCYRKAFWNANRFPGINVGEDTHFVAKARGRLGALQNNRFFVARVHPYNSAKKNFSSRCWHERSIETVIGIIGEDWRAFSTIET
jgi:hypothetical protein